jgi:hypothetical protein
MNRTEAMAILKKHLDLLISSGYLALSMRTGENQAFEVKGESGVTYQIEVDIFWEKQPDGAIRIVGSIDDGGLRAFLPLTESRLVEPV